MEARTQSSAMFQDFSQYKHMSLYTHRSPCNRKVATSIPWFPLVVC